MTAEPAADTRPGRVPSTGTLLFFLVALALITRVSFLMHSIDEPLSACLALGITDFKLALSQPPTLGPYFYLRLVRGLDRLVHDELTTLSLASAVFSCLALVPLFFTLRAVFSGRRSLALAGTTLTAFTYGYWLTGLRPVNDPVAVFFVCSTVIALLLGVDRPGPFCAGGALFGITLGFEPHTVYFLTPLAVIVCVLVFRQRHWAIGSLGIVLFIGTLLISLLPGVHNAGGWTRYEELWQAAQPGTYTLSNLAAHLGVERVKSQLWHDLFLVWGEPVLAIPMLALAVLGVVPFWRAGTRGRLFLVFGVSTLLHIYLAAVPASRYYIYTAPILGAAAAAGVFFLCERVTAWRSTVLPPIYATGTLTLASIALTLPVATRVKTFRSPTQAVYQFLLKKHGGILAHVDLFTDNPTASLALGYYRLKSQISFANGTDDYPAVLPLLGRNELSYFLTDTAIVGGGSHLRLVDSFTWEPSLRNILQCAPEPRVPRTLNLYELKDGLPDEYALRGNRIQPLLFARGLERDGWAGPDAEMILPHDKSPAETVLLEGVIPAEFGFYFPFKIEYRLPNGGRAGEFTISKPGKFSAALPLQDLPPGDFTVLRLLPSEYCIPTRTVPGSKDGRRLCFRLTGVAATAADGARAIP